MHIGAIGCSKIRKAKNTTAISHPVDGCRACGWVHNAIELSGGKSLRRRATLRGWHGFIDTLINHKPFGPEGKPSEKSRDRSNRNHKFPLFHFRISLLFVSRFSMLNPNLPSTLTAPVFPPSKSLEPSR